MIEWIVIILFFVFCGLPVIFQSGTSSYKEDLILGLKFSSAVLVATIIAIVLGISFSHIAFDTNSLYETYLLIKKG